MTIILDDSFAHKLGSNDNLELTRLVRVPDTEAEWFGFEPPLNTILCLLHNIHSALVHLARHNHQGPEMSPFIKFLVSHSPSLEVSNLEFRGGIPFQLSVASKASKASKAIQWPVL